MTGPTRQLLTVRQQETLERFLAEGAALLEEAGHEQVTIRLVASRAGMSAATAYTYVSSKDHLFAELFWRRLVQAEDVPAPAGATPSERVQAQVRHLATVIAGAPGLAAAANLSLLGSDPEVDRLRRDIGALLASRFRAAIGDGGDLDPDVLRTLAFAVTGGLLQAGMGLFTYERLADHLEAAVVVIMRGTR
jgi:AcrR family transcriptional regulator